MGQRSAVLLALTALGWSVSTLVAPCVARGQASQPASRPAAPAGPQPADDLIALNFPESVEIKVLADYVSRRLDLNIIYGEDVGAQRVILRTPARIPKESLLGLLQSALQIKGFAVVDGDTPGIKRIVAVSNLAATARPAFVPQAVGAPPPTAVTQVFRLQHVDAQSIDQALKVFLTQPGGNSLAIPQYRLLVVTDYAGNVDRMTSLIKQIDQPRPAAAIEFVKLEHADAAALSPQLAQMLNARQNAQGGPIPGMPAVEASADPRTNQIVIVGPSERVPEAVDLVRKLDVPLALEAKTYRFDHVSADRVDKMIKQLVDQRAGGGAGGGGARAYQSAVDPARESRVLIAIASLEVHQRIEALKKEMDVAPAKEDSPIRFYRLANTTAADVLNTLRGIVGEGESVQSATSQDQAQQKRRANPGRSNPLINPMGGGGAGAGLVRPNAAPGGAAATQPADRIGGQPHIDPLNRDTDRASAGPVSFQSDDARVTADPNTNTIVVIGAPSVQRMYEELIRHLDKRRPQVLIECTLVSIDTSNDFSLGVEISARGGFDSREVITFSRFGLSTLNKSAHLRIIPGTGFNGALISSDVADVVVQALSRNGRSRVVSAPRILVNDNATGTLTSISEAPYTSINAAVGTISTTTFAGYAQAGTEITLTPHISDADYLQLEYTVSLNNFTGQGSNGIPPPRQTDAVDSTVTIPDGSTIIVGGLNRKNFNKTVSSVPFLGDIPVLEYLVSNRVQTDENSTLFVFLRPVILRDDQFEDLKYLSERDVRAAGIKGDFPESEPVLMR